MDDLYLNSISKSLEKISDILQDYCGLINIRLDEISDRINEINLNKGR